VVVWAVCLGFDTYSWILIGVLLLCCGGLYWLHTFMG